MKKPKLISLPKIVDKRGNLSVIESKTHVPFNIKSSYLIYDITVGEVTDGQAFIQQKEMIIALSGSLDIIVFDGVKEQKFSLSSPNQGLYVPSGFLRYLENFSINSLVLVISNTNYDEKDYIRNKKS